MYRREVTCEVPECEKAAAYKVAAPWRIGGFNELKSYGLACGDHIADVYREAIQRAKDHPLSHQESVGEIGIYGFSPGKHDRELVRQPALESSPHG